MSFFKLMAPVAAVVGSLTLAGAALADPASAKAAVDSAKAAGVVGEQADGFLVGRCTSCYEPGPGRHLAENHPMDRVVIDDEQRRSVDGIVGRRPGGGSGLFFSCVKHSASLHSFIRPDIRAETKRFH